MTENELKVEVNPKDVAAFWAWFKDHEETLYGIKKDFSEEVEALLDELTEQLETVCEYLSCEFSSVKNGKRELIISADGIRPAFVAVDALADSAPELPRWKIIKFRPRSHPIPALEFEGQTIKPDEVECSIASDDRHVAILIFIPRVRQDDLRKQFGYSFLDEALGEYDVETKVSGIEFMSFDKLKDYPRFALKDLPKKFDELYRHINKDK